MTFYYEWYLEQTRNLNSCKENKGFVEWIKKVEDKVILVYGIRLLDLPDENYMLMYEKGVSVERMADKIFENNKI